VPINLVIRGSVTHKRPTFQQAGRFVWVQHVMFEIGMVRSQSDDLAGTQRLTVLIQPFQHGPHTAGG
jgi:hypothetical protein